MAFSLLKFETSFGKSKTSVIFKTKTVLESHNIVEYEINNAKPLIQ
jgi:hypothetical protein